MAWHRAHRRSASGWGHLVGETGLRHCSARRRIVIVEECPPVVMTPPSFRYSTPPLPTRATLTDMVLWYATPESRAELMAAGTMLDATPLAQLIEATMTLLETWQPSSPFEHEVASTNPSRVVEWLVWKTVTATDESSRDVYESIEMIEPWAIALSTLPRYPINPTAVHHR
jgi:hypothetical protein